MKLLKVKDWLKKNKTLIYQKVVGKWHKIKPEQRLKIINIVEPILNYLANALLISVPLTFFSFGFEEFTFKRYLIMVVCIWVSQPFIEHYYVWFRERWKDTLNK